MRSEWCWLPDNWGDNYFSVSNNVEKVPFGQKKLGACVRKQLSCFCASEAHTVSPRQVQLEPCVPGQWPMSSVYPQWDFLLSTLVTAHHPCKHRDPCYAAFKEQQKKGTKESKLHNHQLLKPIHGRVQKAPGTQAFAVSLAHMPASKR